MNKNIIILILILIIGLLIMGFFLFKKEKPEVIKIPIVMEVPVPGIKNTFPPVVLPMPKKVMPKPTLVQEFINSDSIIKDSLYEDLVKYRFYNESFVDSIQIVNVFSKVQGKLLEQSVDYSIFPRTIKVDTVVEYKIPKNIQVFGLMELGSNIITPSPIIKGSLIIKNKRDNLLSISFDSQKNAYIGYGFKF